jgi:hypothetical protein
MRLPALMDAFRAAGSTDLRSHLEVVLGKTWEQLDAIGKNGAVRSIDNGAPSFLN